MDQQRIELFKQCNLVTTSSKVLFSMRQSNTNLSCTISKLKLLTNRMVLILQRHLFWMKDKEAEVQRQREEKLRLETTFLRNNLK